MRPASAARLTTTPAATEPEAHHVRALVTAEPAEMQARRVRDVLAAGASYAELRRRCWTHPHHGVLRPAGETDDPVRRRILDAAALLGGRGAIGGWAALYLHGAAHVDGRDRRGREQPVLVHMGPGQRIRPRPGVTPTRCHVRQDELRTLEGIPVTTAARAAYDQMRLSPGVVEAVVVADLALSRVTEGRRLATGAELAAVLDGHVKTRGRTLVRHAWRYASERSASPEESRLRMFAGCTAGMWRWQVNRPVFDLHGRLVGVPDLLDSVLGLVVEYDGALHDEAVAHAADNVREEAFEDTGLVVVRVSRIDWRHPAQTTRRLHAGVRRAAADTKLRAWTLTEPPWWRGSRPARIWGTSAEVPLAPWESRFCCLSAGGAVET